MVLAGDHCQLPPTVLSADAQREGLGISLLERLVELWGPAITRRLDVQYRMHEAIMIFSSLEFYDGQLEANPLVAGHRLCELAGVRPQALTESPLHFIDTAGAGFDEQREPAGESLLNPDEARLIGRQVRSRAAPARYGAAPRVARRRCPRNAASGRQPLRRSRR